MKAILVFMLAAVVAAVLATALISQRRSAERSAAELKAAQAQIQEKEEQLAEAEREKLRSEQQAREVARVSDDLARQSKAREAELARVAAAAQGNTAPEEGGGGFGKMMAGMMKDPEMKKMIREQQRAMMDQLYAPLVKRLGLTPEEAGQFKELLADNMVKGAETAMSMFGAGDAGSRKEAVSAITAAQKEFNEQMKGFLGTERYEQYKEYQQTLGERTQLTMFKQQMAGEGQTLSEQQTETLLAIMNEEKKSVMARTGLEFPGQDASKMQDVLAEGQVEKLLAAQEEMGQRVFDRAGGVLSAEQLEAFGKFQTNQLQMMKVGLTMARKFMGGEAPAAEAGEK